MKPHKEIEKGIMGAVSQCCGYLLFAVAVAVIGAQTPYFKDDTDPPGWFTGVSGMAPYTDGLTGCQYLTTSSGVIARMDKNGKQICGGK